MSFRQSAGLPPRISLHRYWMYANRMRTHFEAALCRDPPKVEHHTDVKKAVADAARFLADDRGIFMSYWYGGLYVVIEGWRQLKLKDHKIDPLLSSPNVSLLKEFRNGTFHFQKNYFDDRLYNFMKSQTSVDWVRTLSSEFGAYFLREAAKSNK